MLVSSEVLIRFIYIIPPIQFRNRLGIKKPMPYSYFCFTENSLKPYTYHPQPLFRHNPSFGKQNKKSFTKTHQLHLHKYWPK
ncbi:Uncharacterized protein HZ326_31682 [Fusarium oxysporum f. sp. albedinis]|nr:Uncharacterized protein HZ326_31682 [Fusarium oxysporum f. sp. albedinis]